MFSNASLDFGQVVLALPTAEEGEDDQLVEVDIMLSAHANARAMYENKKLARVKELKTLKVRYGAVLRARCGVGCKSADVIRRDTKVAVTLVQQCCVAICIPVVRNHSTIS